MFLRFLTMVLAVFSGVVASSQTLMETKINVSTTQRADLRDAIVYLPAGYKKTKAYPLVVFTHGMGEAGKNVKKLYSQGLPKVLKKGYKPPFEFIMVAVQRNSFSVMPEWLAGILKDTEKRWYIDKSRIYLTGLSAGGWSVYGSQLNFSPAFAKRFAAIVINSAVTTNVNKNNFDWWKQTKTPLWAIVGGADKGYVGKNAFMVNEINKRVPNLATLTVRKGVGHGGWSDVYSGKVKLKGKNMWEWLYQFKRSSAGNSVPPVTKPEESDVDEEDDTDDGGVVVKPTPKPTPTITDTKYIKVNFYSGVNPYTGSRWNNWNVGSNERRSVSVDNLIYDNGKPTTATAVLSHSETIVDNGATYGGSMAPAGVLRYASSSTQTRTLTISGLTPTRKYHLVLFSSRSNKPGGQTQFVVNGVTRTINHNNNKTQKAAYTHVYPNAAGRFVVTIKSTGDYNYINGFQLAELGVPVGK